MLILDAIIYSLQRHGGITVYFNELLQRLANDSINSRVIAWEGSAADFVQLSTTPELRRQRVLERYRRCPVPANARLFHSSYYRLPGSAIPVITTVHDFIYERFVKGPSQWGHSWQKFAAIKASQAVICISENTRRDLLNFVPGINPERIHVIYNGVGHGFYPLPEAPSPNQRPFVLFVGARTGYKNFLPLVHALSALHDYDLICIGGGRLTASESDLVHKHLGHRFAHHMNVSDARLNQFYNDAFCLAYPSSYEGFGIPVLEAMRAGCPVISVNSSSIPEVAGDAAILVPESTPDLLLQAILQLEQTEQRTLYRQRGLVRANEFSWQRTYIETSQIYRSMLDQ